MNRRRRQSTGATALVRNVTKDTTKPRSMPAGHGPKLDPASAQAIADASVDAGFPVPPQAQAVLDDLPADQPAAAPAAVAEEG